MRNTEEFKNNPKRLLEKYNLLNVPVDLKKLTESLNITVKEMQLENNLSGLIEYIPAKDDVSIYIEINDFPKRKNFTIAHEIAHYIYDLDFQTNKENQQISDIQMVPRGSKREPIEKRADKFAEQLLMPKDIFHKTVFEVKKDLFQEENNLGTEKIYKIVNQLSDIFQVSNPAIIVRLSSLSIITESLRADLFYYHYNS